MGVGLVSAMGRGRGRAGCSRLLQRLMGVGPVSAMGRGRNRAGCSKSWGAVTAEQTPFFVASDGVGARAVVSTTTDCSRLAMQGLNAGPGGC